MRFAWRRLRLVHLIAAVVALSIGVAADGFDRPQLAPVPRSTTVAAAPSASAAGPATAVFAAAAPATDAAPFECTLSESLRVFLPGSGEELAAAERLVDDRVFVDARADEGLKQLATYVVVEGQA